MNIEALIAKRLAAPKSFKVIKTYADGATREHQTETRGQAETYAAVSGNDLGKSYPNASGHMVTLVSIEVSSL